MGQPSGCPDGDRQVAADSDTSAARRVILHCGVQKTASTSLQRMLHRNAAALTGQIEVLTPIRGSLTRELGHTAMQFSLDPSSRLEARLGKLARKLRDTLLAGTGPVLISHENLPGAMIGKGGVATLYPHLERITDLLNAQLAPLRPEYVFYTRQMDDWKRSVYNQAVKTDGYTEPCQTFLDATADCGGWNDLERRMQAHLGAGRVTFLRLEDETDETRPGRQLLRLAGLSDATIATLTPIRRRRNQRLTPGALEFLRRLNGLELEHATRSRIVDLVAANQTLFNGEAMIQ